MIGGSAPDKPLTVGRDALRGAQRFLSRVLETFRRKPGRAERASERVRAETEEVVYRVTAYMEQGRFHRAFARLARFSRFLENSGTAPEEISREIWRSFAGMLFPFAPHHAAELHRASGEGTDETKIADIRWPEVPKSPPRKEEVEIAVFFEGALCDRFRCPAGSKKEELGKMALGREKVRNLLHGRRVKWIFTVTDYLISIVPQEPDETSGASPAPHPQARAPKGTPDKRPPRLPSDARQRHATSPASVEKRNPPSSPARSNAAEGNPPKPGGNPETE